MTPSAAESAPEHLLVLAPVGRDAALCRAVLERAGMSARVCADMASLCAEIAAGAGAAIVVEEALSSGGFERLASTLAGQEPWSDFPLLVFSAQIVSKRRSLESLRSLGNVRLLDRPLDPRLLINAAEIALRGRRRQYEAIAAQRRDEAQLRQASDFQHRLIGIAGHDLRSPLAAITMGASLLPSLPPDDPRRARFIKSILISARRMERLVSDLADYSRARVGVSLPLNARACDFHRVCDVVLDELRSVHSGRRIDYDAEGDPLGHWDPDRLQQVLANLLTNAIKYGQPDRPIVLRWWREPAEAGEDLLFEVANHGRPIPPELIPELFEPFRLGRQTKASATQSLGLGLFIVREIVRAHGGTVTARSSLDDGTRLTVRLPGTAPG